METTKRKALYIFLSSILGILLFLMFHRALFVIYEILGNFYSTTAWLHLPFRTIALIDFLTFIVALFIGGWYGIWIGLNWYKMVYEERGVKTWFHGFVPHHWRKHKKHEGTFATGLDFINNIAEKSKTKVAPKKIIITNAPTHRSDSFRSFRTERPSMPWDNEDGAPEPKTVKKVTKKRVVKKTVRKTVAKKKQTV
jgi:hypothetical protein